MRLATYFNGEPRIGIVDGANIWDLRTVYSLYLLERERTSHHAQMRFPEKRRTPERRAAQWSCSSSRCASVRAVTSRSTICRARSAWRGDCSNPCRYLST